MDLFGYNEALAQGNSFTQQAEETRKETTERNQDLDTNIGLLKKSIKAKKGVVDDKTKSGVEQSLVEQATSGYGLNELRKAKNIANTGLKTATELGTLASKGIAPAETLGADVGAVLQQGENFSNVANVPKAGGRASQFASAGESAGEDAVNVVAKDSKLLEPELKAGIKSGAKALGGVGALIGGGMAIEDLESSKKKNGWEKAGDYLNIGGAGTELLGIGLSATPIGWGLDLLGGAASILGSGLDEIGKEKEKKTDDTSIDKGTKSAIAQQTAQKIKQSPSGATAGAFGSAGGGSGSASQLIQGSGAF
tara:strand:- start:754 stop:1680 length:927 start_codon:yes stop_codon:yes gene_type:complete